MKIETVITLLVSGAAVIAFVGWFNNQKSKASAGAPHPSSRGGWWGSGTPDKTASNDCLCVSAPCDCSGGMAGQWAEYGVLTPYRL